MKRRLESRCSNAELKENDRVRYAYIVKEARVNIRIPTDEEKNLLSKGMFIHATEDRKTKAAKEIGRRKPYEVCCGGIYKR